MKKFSEIVETHKKRKEFKNGEAARWMLFRTDFNFVRCRMESKERFDQSIDCYNQFIDRYSDVLLPSEVDYYKNRAAKEFESLSSKLATILSSAQTQKL